MENQVYLLNNLFDTAIQKKASDIHLHSEENQGQILIRCQGQLIPFRSIDKDLYQKLINRIKVISSLNNAPSQTPLDGRTKYQNSKHEKDLRISIIPSIHGESVVIRLLSDQQNISSLEKIGLTEQDISQTKKMLEHKEGLILATGPTGSGKTTTIYSFLKHLQNSRPFEHIVSIEDPVEYKFPGITQIQIKESLGFDFPETLRAVLRHDPDIIFIGEIRDETTAKIAVRASLTGHLVLTTLHTTSTATTINRLEDYGVNKLYLQDCLKAIYNQRLHKKTCTACQGKGCTQCINGFSERYAHFDIAYF